MLELPTNEVVRNATSSEPLTRHKLFLAFELLWVCNYETLLHDLVLRFGILSQGWQREKKKKKTSTFYI